MKLLISAIEEDSLLDEITLEMSRFLIDNLVNCLHFERQRTSNNVSLQHMEAHLLLGAVGGHCLDCLSLVMVCFAGA